MNESNYDKSCVSKVWGFALKVVLDGNCHHIFLSSSNDPG